MTSPQRGKTGIARIVQATQVSFEGFVAAFRFEAAFRQELLLAALLIPLALILPVQPLGRALMIGSVLLLLITELLNSAVEAAVDRISTERHNLAKRAKDMGSAAVFLSLVNLAAVWLLVLLA